MRQLILSREEVFRGPLLLVNGEHPLTCAVRPALTDLNSAYGRILLEREAAARLLACVRAAGGEGEILPVSGWRSREEQQSIWDDTLERNGEDFTRTYVARPGCSEHETGLAIDLALRAEEIDFIRPEFPYDGPCGAFRSLAARYGFIERYRADKQELTGIGQEPWHFRYVGAPHAVLMESNRLCLEEYGDFLRKSPRQVRTGGATAWVCYIPCAGERTVVRVPDGPCQAAGDNVNGYYLTVWRWDR